MRKIVVCLICLTGAVVSCSSDPNEQANRLFVEAQQMIEAAGKQGPEERLRTLRAAKEKLETIIGKYPSANLAVQLVSGQSVGRISLGGIGEAVGDAAWAVCVTAPTRPCVLDEALRLIRATEEAQSRSGRADFELTSIAGAQAKTGRIDDALQLARSIKNSEIGNLAYEYIAEALAKAGKTSEALRIAHSITGGNRTAILLGIVRRQAMAGRTSNALQLMQALEHDDYARAVALAGIAEAQARAGLADEAAATFKRSLALIPSISREFDRVDALSEIAEAQMNAGLTREAATSLTQALEVAQAITHTMQRGGALASIAKARARAGKMSDALQLAQAIESQSHREDALRLIVEAQAVAQARAGKIDEAMQLAQSILSDTAAKTLAAEGKLNEALRLAQAIKDEFSRARALALVARAQAKAGRAEDATATFKLSLQTAQSIKHEAFRALGLAQIARVQTEARLNGEGAATFKRSLQVAQSITDKAKRAGALGNIAMELPD
jgi:tetratricopeptide (TPR) repeat protein